MKPHPISSTAVNVRGTVVTYGIRILLAGVVGVVVSRALSPEGRGDYYIVVMLAATATAIGNLSIGKASVTFWATDRGGIPANSLLLGPILGLTSAALTCITVVVLGPAVVPVASHQLLVLALAVVPASVTVVLLTTVALLAGRVQLVNRSQTVSAIAQCGAVIVLGALGHLTTAAVVWIWAASSTMPLVFLVRGLRPFDRPYDRGLARRMVGAAARYHVGVIALFLLLRVDVLILNAMSTAIAVGLYSLAVTVGEMIFVGTEAMSQAMLRGQAESHLGRASDLTIRSTRASVVMASGTIGALCLAAPFLMPVLYGEAFRESSHVLFALAPGLLAFAATRSIGGYLLRLGRPWLMSGMSLLALLGNIGLNLMLIPPLGVLGCALATSAGYLVLAACQVAWFSRAAAVPPTTLLPRSGDLAWMWSEVCGLVFSTNIRRRASRSRVT